MSVILGTVGLLVLEIRVVSRRDRYPVTDGVAANDEATGVDTRTTDSTLQHFGILDGIAQCWVVRGFGITKFGHSLDGVYQIHFRCFAVHIGQTVGNGLTQRIADSNRHLLHTGYILQTVLGGHGGIGDDVRTVLMTIFIFHPFQHLAAPVIIEVGINIGQ